MISRARSLKFLKIVSVAAMTVMVLLGTPVAQEAVNCAHVISQVLVPTVSIYESWQGPATDNWPNQQIPIGTIIKACAPNNRFQITVGFRTVWIDAFAVEIDSARGGFTSPPDVQPPLGGTLARYPSRPIVIIVAAGPGSVADIVGRVLSENLSQALGSQVIVEDRPGAGGSIGAIRVATSAPDGYTLLLSFDATLVIDSYLRPNLPYKTEDFVAVAAIASAPYALVVNTSLSVSNVKELIDLAKKEPGKLTFGTLGTETISNLNLVMFERTAGVRFTPVHYRGASSAVASINAQEIQAMFLSMGQALPLAQNGKLKLLAVTGSRRVSQASDVPTIAESGFTNFNSGPRLGLFAPRHTSTAVVAKINQEVRKITSSATFRNTVLDRQVLVPLITSPEEFAAAIKADSEEWGRLVRDAGIKLE